MRALTVLGYTLVALNEKHLSVRVTALLIAATIIAHVSVLDTRPEVRIALQISICARSRLRTRVLDPACFCARDRCLLQDRLKEF